MSLCGFDADVCSSALLIPAILGCGRTEPPLNPLSEFAEPALEAAFAQAAHDLSPLLIEATCNQVNQEGGYTGLTPAQFLNYVHSIAKEMHFPTERLILGGDHLGPN